MNAHDNLAEMDSEATHACIVGQRGSKSKGVKK